MEDKKGFTLVELLAVIVIISLIAGLALSRVVEQSNEYKNTGQTVLNEIVLNAAKQYVRGNESIKQSIKDGTALQISYQDLVDKGYLSDNLKSIKLVGDDLTEKYICITYDSSKSEIVYEDGSCN